MDDDLWLENPYPQQLIATSSCAKARRYRIGLLNGVWAESSEIKKR